MKQMAGSWLRQGFFVVGEERFMRDVRDALQGALSLRRGSLRIYSYPPYPEWKHTYWWRENSAKYAEAQFFAQIAKGYPILSLGVAIEKGYETPYARPKSAKLLNRRTWDWPRLVREIDTLLEDAREISQVPGGPVNLRISSKAEPSAKCGWLTRAFSLLENGWFERYVGEVADAQIADCVRDLDGEKDTWVIVHFAQDLGPAEAKGLSPLQVVNTLMAFDELRRRLRGLVEKTGARTRKTQ